MIRVVKGDRDTCLSFIEELKTRVGETEKSVEETVSDILKKVKSGGDEAVKALSLIHI